MVTTFLEHFAGIPTADSYRRNVMCLEG